MCSLKSSQITILTSLAKSWCICATSLTFAALPQTAGATPQSSANCNYALLPSTTIHPTSVGGGIASIAVPGQNGIAQCVYEMYVTPTLPPSPSQSCTLAICNQRSRDHPPASMTKRSCPPERKTTASAPADRTSPPLQHRSSPIQARARARTQSPIALIPRSRYLVGCPR